MSFMRIDFLGIPADGIGAGLAVLRCATAFLRRAKPLPTAGRLPIPDAVVNAFSYKNNYCILVKCMMVFTYYGKHIWSNCVN